LSFILEFMPLVIVSAMLVILYLTVFLMKRYHKHRKRRSPFTQNLLRSPGESLNSQLRYINDEIMINLCLFLMTPLLFYSFYISDLYFKRVNNPHFVILIYGGVSIIFMGYFFFQLIKYVNLRRAVRLGYEGEVAVAQELNQLIRDGFFVYHDFPADGFNIDHIVVGPPGVYAVETKARSKPTSDDRASDAKVIYDGRKLQFPNWSETKPLEQARNQALWLGHWLSSATGCEIQVQPVITLPGWFVKRVSSKGLPVINPKQFRSIARPINGNILNENQIKRIVHQIDQKCRDVEPKANKGLGGEPGIEAPLKT